MKIHFDRRPGVLQDMIFSLYFINNQNFTRELAKYDITPNKDVVKILQKLGKHIDLSKDYFDVFFKDQDGHFSGVPAEGEAAFWKYPDIESYINMLETIDEASIRYELIKNAGNFKMTDNERVLDILKDDRNFIAFIDGLEVDSSLKWKTFKVYNNAKNTLLDFANFLKSYYPIYTASIKKIQKTIDEYNTYFEKSIAEKGSAFLKEIFGTFWHYDDFEDIYITPLFINSVSANYFEKENEAFLYLGFEFQKILNQISGVNEIDVNINILKNLSDKTRFNILSYLMKDELFGLEIAEKVGISMATVSYHMSFLLISRIVNVEKKGLKTFYTINKDTLRNNIEFLVRTFQL